MAIDSNEASGVKPDARKRLMDSITSHIARGNAVYAVLDGALFDDLPTQLNVVGIAHRSLYRGGDRNIIVGGPWLVDLSHHHPTDDDLYEVLGDDSIKLKDEIIKRPADPATQIEALSQIVLDTRAAVFWIGDPSLTEDSLYTHLRTINEILIPGEATQAPERVTFRHADANVMAQVLPALDEAQFTRLLGPASSILFTPHDDWGGGLKRADRPEGNLTPLAGPLFFDAGTMQIISARRIEGSRRKVMAYLREVDPYTTELPDDELHGKILEYEESGNKLGLDSEQAHMKWAYMMSISQGEIGTAPETRIYFADTSKHPNDRINDLLDDFTEVWAELEHII